MCVTCCLPFSLTLKRRTHGTGDILMSHLIGIGKFQMNVAISQPVVMKKSFCAIFISMKAKLPFTRLKSQRQQNVFPQLHLERANEDITWKKFLHRVPLGLMRYLLADASQKNQRKTSHKSATKIFLHPTTCDDENFMENYHRRICSSRQFRSFWPQTKLETRNYFRLC